ncbi:MAG: hypothetical protein QM302_06540 [Acidobacteriota bacterium]|nr:hypothetical protein [Acidobacteriota bacterium]
MSNQSLPERLMSWMRGRYGADELGNTAVGLSVLLLLLNLLVRSQWLNVVALVPAVYACWRMTSANVPARRGENRAFLEAIGPVAQWVRNPRAVLAERRAYKHLTCPSCKKKMRVPRGKGRMRVTCPSCHKKFETRS